MDDLGVAGGSGGSRGPRQGRAKAQEGLGAEFIAIKITLSRHKKKGKSVMGSKQFTQKQTLKIFF